MDILVDICLIIFFFGLAYVSCKVLAIILIIAGLFAIGSLVDDIKILMK